MKTIKPEKDNKDIKLKVGEKIPAIDGTGIKSTVDVDLEKRKEELKQVINNEVPEKKERKKRVTKEEKLNLQSEETEKKKIEFIESVKGFGSMILNLVIKRLPNPIPLTEDESKSFDLMFSRVAFKYSDMLGSYQDEFGLLAVSIVIISPRIKKVKTEPIPKESNEQV
jgi:hypothetical protein